MQTSNMSHRANELTVAMVAETEESCYQTAKENCVFSVSCEKPEAICYSILNRANIQIL